jgi:glutathione synthase/RimK-type ligase-like ATP-grasp enzyme
MSKPVSIAIGLSGTPWDDRFAEALDEKRAAGYPLNYAQLDLDRHDWLALLRPYDVVIWKSPNMGVTRSQHFKEKVYVLEKHCGKLVVPNVDSMWHFESKVAQSHLFAAEDIPTPATTVTFSWQDAEQALAASRFPLVFKKGEGAASTNVRLVKSRRAAMRLWAKAFSSQIYRAARLQGRRWHHIALHSFWKQWFWEWFGHRLRGSESVGYLYWQEFLDANAADLRITVIGDRYAYGFWRNNRPNDFRASGSGRIDFERAIPADCVRACMAISRRLNFDSMAYDILFKDGQFVIGEISYGYVDWAPQHAAGHYELCSDAGMKFVTGHVWPQTLWVDWALRRWEDRCGAETQATHDRNLNTAT